MDPFGRDAETKIALRSPTRGHEHVHAVCRLGSGAKLAHHARAQRTVLRRVEDEHPTRWQWREIPREAQRCLWREGAVGPAQLGEGALVVGVEDTARRLPLRRQERQILKAELDVAATQQANR